LLPLILLVSLTAYGDDRSVALSLAENNRNFRYLRIALSFNAPVSLPAGARPATIRQGLPEAQMDIQRALAAQPALQYRAEDDDTRYYLDAEMLICNPQQAPRPTAITTKASAKLTITAASCKFFTPTATVLTAHRSPSSPTSYRKISVNPE